MSRRTLLAGTLVFAGAIWAATVAAAYQAIHRFETTPGEAAIARQTWPAATHLARTPGTWSLVMFVHPHCSCSRASIGELAAIVEKAPRDLQTSVLVYRPHDAAPGWERTDVYASAKRLRNARVVVDDDGAEAAVFGGFTSGQTFLYDAGGRLRFAGGITSLRGHAGINRGRIDVLSIATKHAGNGTHPVFGCAISTRTTGARP
jgi:hypothetical protein